MDYWSIKSYLLSYWAFSLQYSLGQFLSSFNSALNSSVTLFGLDIYKQYIKKDADERQVVKAGKLGIVLALLSMFIAPTIANAPKGLFGYLQEINGCYSIPILTIILVGYLTKYVPALAAKVAMASGVILYSISQFFLKDYVIENGGTYPHFLHIMAILFLFNIVIMLLIGKFKPRAVAYEQAYTEQVDITPWKHINLMGAIVILIVVSTYFIFT